MNEEILLNVGLAEDFEGFEGMPYQCPAGFTSIGFGRNLEVYPYTRAEAIEWTAKIMAERRKELIIRLPWLVEAPKEIRILLTDMAYNLGTRGVLNFVYMIEALKNKNYELAAEELKDSKYYEQTGNRSKFHYDTLKSLGELQD